MLNELSPFLLTFSVCFSRNAAFYWFIVIVFGLIVCLDFYGITSFIRWLTLEPNYYETLLHFSKASSWRIMVGDGIKASKEAKKIPSVKKLHQEIAIRMPVIIRGKPAQLVYDEKKKQAALTWAEGKINYHLGGTISPQ